MGPRPPGRRAFCKLAAAAFRLTWAAAVRAKKNGKLARMIRTLHRGADCGAGSQNCRELPPPAGPHRRRVARRSTADAQLRFEGGEALPPLPLFLMRPRDSVNSELEVTSTSHESTREKGPRGTYKSKNKSVMSRTLNLDSFHHP